MSRRTEEAYVQWILRYLQYIRSPDGTWVHPSETESEEVNDFLTMLAVERNVAASTQNQALSALLFLFSQVLKSEIRFDAVRAKRPVRLPAVMSVDEVRSVLREIPLGPI